MSADPWICAHCGKRYPIPPMARDCEKRHRALTEESTQ